MKTLIPSTRGQVGLVEWLKQPAPRDTVVIGATCGCDLSRLGSAVCERLNAPDLPTGGRCLAFDAEDIRLLAGDPFWRHSLLAAAARYLPAQLATRCDYETLVRAVAATGGAVLTGQAALEATADMANVFRVALSHCERCRPESTLYLDPASFTEDGLATVIGKRFLRWHGERENARHRLPGSR